MVLSRVYVRTRSLLGGGMGRRLQMPLRFVTGCLAALACVPAESATPVQTNVTYQSTVTADSNGPLDLIAELNYDSSKTNAPIAVVMHPYGGVTPALTINAQRLRDAGFFVISPTMRGQGGSDGVRDSGGVEIYDIFDAVEHVKSTYAPYVDSSNVSITGYSGGGGNVMSALTKFPDYFRAGSAFFGMSDYGYDKTHGWFFDGADAGNKGPLLQDVGDPSTNDPVIEDRYMARASNLASKNNPYSEIHLFVNHDETNVPPINNTRYRDYAIAAATSPGEFDNIQVHIGGHGQYVDFNGNNANDPDELQDWPHQLPTANQQHAGEAWYLSRLLDGSIAQPELNVQDELFVAGYVKTERFGLWLGNGQNAAGDLAYDLDGDAWSFGLNVLSNDKNVTGKLSVDTADWAGRQVVAKLNGAAVQTFHGGGVYQFNNLADGDLFTLDNVGVGVEGAVITGETATASSQYNGMFAASNAVSNSGISGAGSSLAVDGAFVHNGTNTNMWLTALGSPIGDTLTVDLGALYNVDGMRIWNFNEISGGDAGVSSYHLETSADGSTWTSKLTGAPLAQAPGAAGYAGVYSGVEWNGVQFVRFTIADTYRPGDDIAGIAEIMFSGALALPPDPVITGETATASSQLNGSFSPSKAVNNVGISAIGSSLATDGDFVHNGTNTNMWLTAAGSPIGDTLTIDLGAQYDVSGMRIWNFNEIAGGDAGVSSYHLETSADGSTWTTQLTSASLAEAPGEAGYAGVYSSVEWDGVQFVRFTIADTYRPTDDIAGIAEIMFSGTLSAGADNADFDGDGDVDGADFLTWQRGVGVGDTPATGDANDDDLVNGTDLAIWEGQFGGSAVATAPVPEPATYLLAMAAAIGLAAARMRAR